METTFTYDRYVTGKNHIGRKAEREKLEAALAKGVNVVIYEPPKVGKTSLLRQTFFEMKVGSIAFRTAEYSLLSVRTAAEFATRLASTVIGIYASTPDEHEGMAKRYLGGSNLKFDAAAFAARKSFIRLDGDLTDDDLRAVLNLPYRIAEDRREKLYVTILEFQNILLCEDPDRVLRIYEETVRKSTPRQREHCCWIWVGSQVNAMKQIFEKQKYFYRMVERIKLDEISYKEIEGHVIRGFLVSGKVIEKDLVRNVCLKLRCNIYYINHFAAICDGLSRGYITVPIVEESMLSLLAMHEPRFIATMNDLTTFQVYLLKAVLDGEYKFSSAEVIDRYSLNSSANVKRLKDALCKKEIITFTPDDRAYVLDPLFEYWLRKYYFTFDNCPSTNSL